MKQANIKGKAFLPIKITTSVLLALSLILTTTVGSFAYAKEQGSKSEAVSNTQEKSNSPRKVDDQGKEEVVYATLSAAGNIEGIYVVNQFQVDSSKVITDYGNYSSVSNLSSTEEIKQNGETVTVNAEKGDFYYEGVMESSQLPWDFAFTYKMDGKTVSPEELAGQSGTLEIDVTAKQNKTLDSTFYDNYMLQITFALDAEKSSNVKAEGATIANAGTNKTIVYTVMPGKDADISISADVVDFEMSGVTIAGMPFSASIDAPDTDTLLDEMDILSSAISDLNDGVGQLAGGTLTLSKGTSQFTDGSSAYQSGMNSLSTNAALITSGSAQIKSAFNAIATGVDKMDFLDLASFSQLPAALNLVVTGLTSTADTLAAVHSNYSVAYATLDADISTLSAQTLNFTNLQSVVSTSGDTNAQAELNAMIAYYAQVQTLCSTYYSSVQAPMQTTLSTLNALTDQASQTSLYAMATSLSSMASAVQLALDTVDVDQLEQLFTELKTFSAEYDTFHKGLLEYCNGVTLAAEGYSSLNAGIVSFSDGVFELSQGTQELSAGATQLNEGMAILPDEMQKRIDEMLNEYTGSDFDPISFVSSKNTNVSLVQFVIVSDAIMLDSDPVEEVPEEENDSSPWDQLLKLFG